MAASLNASYQTITFGTIPLGALCGGWAAEVFGAHVAASVAGLIADGIRFGFTSVPRVRSWRDSVPIQERPPARVEVGHPARPRSVERVLNHQARCADQHSAASHPFRNRHDGQEMINEQACTAGPGMAYSGYIRWQAERISPAFLEAPFPVEPKAVAEAACDWTCSLLGVQVTDAVNYDEALLRKFVPALAEPAPRSG